MFAGTEAFLAYMKQLQSEGKVILPGELVRRVKAGPGPDSLGQAQHASTVQAGEQRGIEADTLTVVGRLESAWSGQSGDAAKGALRPLADVATSASTALHDGQNTLTDQAHAFTSTRDSLHEVSDVPPSRSGWDVATPWDTDTEDAVNHRNAAVQQNNAVYQVFTGTSDGHAQKMPVDYGQVPDAADGVFAVQPATDTSQVQGGHDHREQVTPGHNDIQQRADRPGSDVVAPPPTSDTVTPGQQGRGQQVGGQQQQTPVHVPAATDHDGTRSAGYVPPGTGGTGQPGFGPGGYSPPYVPGSGPGGSTNVGPGGGYLPGVPGAIGAGSGSGTSVRGGGPAGGVVGEPGKATGAGRLAGPGEQGFRGSAGPGAAGARGANGMPMGAGAGKGSKEEDKEHKTPDYLQEADPNAVFGYDGKATPPVIGK